MPESRLATIAKAVRDELDAKNRYSSTNNYDRTNDDVFSEGISGDNFGKDPLQNPQTITQAYNTVGSKDDIKARISNDSPGSLAKNKYWAGGNNYDEGDVTP
jgi:hypothetical protein